MSDLNVSGDVLWKCLEYQAGPYPDYLKKVLTITKYDTLYDVAHLTEEDTGKMEKFVRETLPLIVEDEREPYYCPLKTTPQVFEFSQVDMKILNNIKLYAKRILESREMVLKQTSPGTTCFKKDPSMDENINDGYKYEPVIEESGHLETKSRYTNMRWLSLDQATVALVKPDNGHILPWIRSQIRGVIVSQALPIKDFKRSLKRYRAIGNCFEWSAHNLESGSLRHFRFPLSSPVAAKLFSQKFDELVTEFQQGDLVSHKQRLHLDTEACRKSLVGKNEELVFSERAKLFVRGDQWQECAVGEVGVSHNSDLKRTRLVFVMYHVHKVVLDCVLTTISPSFWARLPLAAGILWTGINYARNACGENESFAIRFNENEKQRVFIKTLATFLEESASSGNDSKIALIVDLPETLFREEVSCEIRKGTGLWSPRVRSQVFLLLDYHNKVRSIVVQRQNEASFQRNTAKVTPSSGEYTVCEECFEWISKDKKFGTDLKIYFSSQASALSFRSTLEESKEQCGN